MEIKKTVFKPFFFVKKKLQSQNILTDSDNFLHPGLLQKMHVFSEKTFSQNCILDILKMSNSEYIGKVLPKKSVEHFFQYFYIFTLSVTSSILRIILLL